MKTITVNVTQRDIDAAWEAMDTNPAFDATKQCPIARALHRHPATRRVAVTGDQVLISGQLANLPAEAIAFVVAFDSGEPVAPFTFTLEVQQ